MKKSFIISSILLSAFSYISAKEDSSGFISLKPQGIKNLGIEYVTVEKKNFESTVFAIGHIREMPKNHSVLSSRISGRITEINAFEGDMVKKGDTLVKVESRQPGNPPPTIALKAPRDGIVISSHVRLGEPVEPAKELLDIIDIREVWATAQIPEDAVSKIKPGTKAHIRIPALGGETIHGTLLRFDPKVNQEGGTIGAIFQVPNDSLKLRPGTRAEFSIVISSRKDVMAVPRAAIQGDASNRVVYAKHIDFPNAFSRLPVHTGEENDRYVEIISGVFPGDEIVTRGSYSLSFASGTGISLKEALDAAHGHEHNEDGSEITDAQKKKSSSTASGSSLESTPTMTIFFAATTGILFILLILSSLRKRSTSAT